MKLRNLIVIALSFLTVSLQGAAPAIPVGRQNQVQSDANQQAFQQQPFFTLAVLQDTTGYTNLADHLKAEQRAIRAAGYDTSEVDPKDWHLSVIILAVPFPNGRFSAQYAQNALDALEAIINKHLARLTGVQFKFKELSSIGPKFLAAMYERVGKKAFYRVYGDIIREFFDLYPNSWSFYGYSMVPHISVAMTPKGSAPVAVPIQIQTAPRKAIPDVELRFTGRAYQRKLKIAARYKDAQNKWVELESNPI